MRQADLAERQPAERAEHVPPFAGSEQLSAHSELLNGRPQIAQMKVRSARLSEARAKFPLSEPMQRRPNRTGLPDDLKDGVETLSGLSMDDVKVHYGSAKPAGLGALAYTQGSDIHLGPGQERHLAHEAWHVVQQKQGRVRPTLQAKGAPINDDPGLEREADMMGRQGEQIGASDGKGPEAALVVSRRMAGSPATIIQREPVPTLGGTFDANPYETATQGPGADQFGSFSGNIKLYFTPNDMVKSESTKIGLIQTVKTLKTTAPDDAEPTVPSTPGDSPAKAAYKLSQGDVGRGIDKKDRSDDDTTNTNPFYATSNKNSVYSETLQDAASDSSLGHLWKSELPNVPASLFDKPQQALDFAGQKWKQSFEVTALVADGALKNSYLGSVAWGMEKPAQGDAVLSPAQLTLVSAGIPSTAFIAAAKSWNDYNAGKRDVGQGEAVPGGQVDAVKLPLPSQGANAPDQDLAGEDALFIALARVVVRELAANNETTDVDKTNTRFQKLALAAKIWPLVEENYDERIDALQGELFTEQVKTAMKGSLHDRMMASI